MRCEVCGSEADRVFKVSMEGSIVTVCGGCKDLGNEPGPAPGTAKSRAKPSKRSRSTKKKQVAKPSGSRKKKSSGSRRSRLDLKDEVVEDYPTRIRKGREENGLTQKELAEKIGEKRSLLGHLEKGDKLPSDKVVKKLERTLDIELKTSTGDFDVDLSSESGELSFGDVVDIKRKK